MNFKKLLCAALAVLTLLPAARLGAFAEETAADAPLFTAVNQPAADYSEAAAKLQQLDILKGDGNGDLMLEDEVTRYQAALFFAQILTGKTSAADWNHKANSAYYTDVLSYADAIDLLTESGKIRGIGGGLFGYNAGILYRDMLVLAVRLLGEETEGMTYPADYIARAESLGLCANLAVDPGANLRRGECAQLMFNLLGLVPKGESETLCAAFEKRRAEAEKENEPAPQPEKPADTVDTVKGSDKTYMIALSDYAVELDSDAKYKYRLTVSGLYDLRAKARVTPFSILTDTLADNKLYNAKPGTLVYYNGNSRVTVCENLLTDAVSETVKQRFVDLYNFDRKNSSAVWIDKGDLRVPSADTAVCDALGLDGEEALAEMTIRLTTINMTALDADDYDFEGAYLDRLYNEADGFDVGTVSVDGKDRYAYPLVIEGDVEEETADAPTADVFDDFILETAGETIRIPRKSDSDVTAGARIELYIVGSVKRSALDLSVIKLIVAD